MRKTIFMFLCLVLPTCIFAQVAADKNVLQCISQRGEAKICIEDSNIANLQQLSNTISLDRKKGSTWIGYVNQKQYNKFLTLGIKHSLVKQNGTKALTMANTVAQMSAWNRYPSYVVYDSMMRNFALQHSNICKLDTIGFSTAGRLILCLKISTSPSTELDKPKFFYTSSIHGDEITGIVLMLRLADWLLQGYGTDSRATTLINNTQIFINPMANPDGTYHGGNNNVSGATRYNANYVDLNRNYPDPVQGYHSDDEQYQNETLAFMAYADNNSFDLSSNLHGGSEVFNYPYDCYTSTQKEHADKLWFDNIGNNFFDSIDSIAPSSFFTDVAPNGVVDGGDWYTVFGGRQDWSTYFKHSREITIEISSDKELAVSSLNNYWTYLKSPFITFMENTLYGLQGYVRDSLTLSPLKAKIWIENHDAYNSEIYSKTTSGYYYRPISAGTYNITYSADGYTAKTIYNVTINSNMMNQQDVLLCSNSSGLQSTESNTNLPLVYTIYNAIGIELQRGTSTTTNLKTLTKTLPKGFYIIQIGKTTHKYVKQ